MYAYQYEGEHSISFINQNWTTYSDFTHNFSKGQSQRKTKVDYLGYGSNSDGRAHLDRNTWEDWGLIPTSRPIVVPPEQKITKIEIPGTSGDLDLTYEIVPYPIFQNRTGSWEFKVASDKPWFVLQQEIGSYLHGRDVRVILKDDPSYYYTGVCHIESWNSANDGSGSTISIGYDLEPYKKYIYSSIDEWEWNPFNFYTDVVPTKVFKGANIIGTRTENRLKISDVTETDWTKSCIIDLTGKIGSMPLIPKITITAGNKVEDARYTVYIRYTNPSIMSSHNNKTPGSYYLTKTFTDEITIEDPEILFYDSFKHQQNKIAFYIGFIKDSNDKILKRSNATVNIDFTRGEIL